MTIKDIFNLHAALICWVLSAPIFLHAQELHFRRYTIEDGFVHSGTGSREVILQDKEGFMWFSTHNGVSRFDGMEFKNFRFDPRNPHSLGNNMTVGIVETDDGKIWVGTSDEGLFIFDPETETFKSERGAAADACSVFLNTLNKDKDGNIWIGTRFNGFCKWVKKTGAFENIGNLDNGHHFYQQKDGTVWLGIHSGLVKVLPNGTIKNIPNPIGEQQGWRYSAVQEMTELPNGKLLLTSSFDGFWAFDPVTETYRDLIKAFHFNNSKAPTAFLPDQKGKIWMAGQGELWYWDSKDHAKIIYLHDDKDPNSPPASKIPCLFKDRAGNLWLITADQGIAVAKDLNNPFETIAEEPTVQLLPWDENKPILWTYKGAFQYDVRQKKRISTSIPIESVKGDLPRLIPYSEDDLLIYEGTKGRLKWYNRKTGKVKLLPKTGLHVRVACRKIWDGINCYNEPLDQFESALPEFKDNIPGFIPKANHFVDIVEDEDQKIWIATTKGLFHYDLQTKQGKSYFHDPNNSNSIPSNVCQPMFAGAHRRMYLATTNGLSVYDPAKDQFDNYSLENGLLHNEILTLVEDAAGNPWIGTALGLQKLDLKTGIFTNFNAYDGMPGKPVDFTSSCRDKAGWLYFVAGDRAFRFHPDSLPVRNYSAPVHLLDFFLNHQQVSIGGADSILHKMLRYTDAITLPFDKNEFGFSFVMPVFYKAEKTVYYYRLLPYEKEWQSAGNTRETHYTNIDPGKYSFQVKAKTATGFWCTKEASVEIVILPPWHATWWARSSFVLLLGGSVVFYYRRKLKSALEKAESQRLRDLNALKTRLYTNITHEFRTPLTIIMGMLDNIRGFDNERGLIRRNSKNLLRLINQLLDLSKLDSGTMKMDLVQSDIIQYLRYLSESFYSMASEKKIDLTFSSDIPELVMDYDEVKIQHIMYNLLSNALKFTGPGGSVVLLTSQLENNGQPVLSLRVSDTGIGIPEDQLAHIFDRFYQADSSHTRKGEGTGIGLTLTKELVEMMGGSITVASSPGEGTTFTLLFPVRLDAATPKPAQASPLPPTLLPDMTNVADSDAAVTSPVHLESPNTDKPVLLLIEDNADVVTYIVSLLKKEYEIHTAPNGRLGIERALEIIPDIIISDVMMPEMDGYEVCETLKKDERTSHIPIILLTAKAAEADRIIGLRMGADAYLMKPFNKEELFVRLEKLLELRRVLQNKYARWEAVSMTEVPSTLEDSFLRKLRFVVEEHLDDPNFDVPQLCQAAHLSNMQVNRKLKALTDKTPSRFIRSVRLHKAKELLQSTELNISEIAYEVGFSDPNYFSRSFSEEFGVPPMSFRK
ncbi:MAG: ATP-binding protein [Saprospiraceae bacterium]|nr:ATP-binding protein [Saprospiraceae bacterium]